MSVMVIESHPLMREALCAAIAGEAEMKLAGQFASFSDAEPALTAYKPDVVLFSIGNPGLVDINEVASLRKSHPDTAILALTSSEVSGQEQAALDMGAQAVLGKSAPRVELNQALRGLSTFRMDSQKMDFEHHLDHFLSGLEASSPQDNR